jgi:hypothetical protein
MASAQRENESLKKHGDVLERAIEDADRHAQGSKDPIPMPESGGHEKSHAAHLGGNAHDRTKPQIEPGQRAAQAPLREPPQEISRVGKEHRKQ